MGGGNIPYHGYTGVTMEIPEIKRLLMMMTMEKGYLFNWAPYI